MSNLLVRSTLRSRQHVVATWSSSKPSFYATDASAASEQPTIAEQVEKPERVFFKNQAVIDGFKVFDPYMNKKKEGFAFTGRSRSALYRRQLDDMARYHKMPIDQDWNNVWPTASMFKQCTVPFAVRQGYVRNSSENDGLPPEKYANTELMKIPNFLHLTPPQIKKHCQALKKFCTEFPKELKYDKDYPYCSPEELCRIYFPVEITTSTYIYDGPSIRDDRARKVTLKINLDDLNLNERARFKFKDLVGTRYDPQTNIVTIESERCPYRQQNEDYVFYLLTTLYFESQKIESWEEEITPDFSWEKSPSKANVVEAVSRLEGTKAVDGEAITKKEEVEKYKKAVANLFDQGANAKNMEAYKKSVLDLLKLAPQPVKTEVNQSN